MTRSEGFSDDGQLSVTQKKPSTRTCPAVPNLREYAALAASFYFYMLAFGTGYTVGVFFDTFRDYFGSDNASTAMIGAVFTGTTFLLGPAGSACVKRYGCRTVAMLGSAITAVSIFVSTFSPSMPVFVITFGVFGGVGCGFTHLAAIISVGHYFQRRRALATGITLCGGGIGTFILAPFFDALLMEYGWRGALWIHSGIFLNGIVFSFAYHPLRKQPSVNLNLHDADAEPGNGYDARAESQAVEKDSSASLLQHKENDLQLEEPRRSVGEGEAGHDLERETILTDVRERETDACGALLEGDAQNKPGHFEDEDSNVVIEYGGHIHDVRAHDDVKHTRSDRSVCESVSQWLNFSLMKSRAFVLVWLSTLLWNSGVPIPNVFLPPMAHDLDIDSTKAALLLSIIGIFSTVSRILVGFVSDQPWANCVVINICVLLLTGLMTSVVPYLQSYGLLVMYTSVYGLCTGAFITLRTPILLELLGLERYGDAFGLLCLASSLSSFLGPPFAGFLSDVTGDYSTSFHVIGGMYCLSAAICVPVRRVARWEMRSTV